MNSRFPDKLFYRIGDVSEITGIKPHVLRYWESEFSGLHPRKNRAGQRIYERRDVELVLEIKTLLYEQRFTIWSEKISGPAAQAHGPEALGDQRRWRAVGGAEHVSPRTTWPPGAPES